jgi:YfiR/HmsC-like
MNGFARSIDAWRSALVAMACALVAGTAAGQAPLQPTEEGVKAAYLYRFLAHVEWPPAAFASPDAPLEIGVVGADEVSDELQRVVAGRQVNGRAVKARRLADDESVERLHMVFIGRAVRHPARLVERLRGRPVLIVMEGASSLDAGAMLSLVPVGGRIRFEASPMLAERAGLKLGARLLALAERVVTR